MNAQDFHSKTQVFSKAHVLRLQLLVVKMEASPAPSHSKNGDSCALKFANSSISKPVSQ